MPKACFAPVADERTRVLILGSLPGERSLAAAEYYAHPRNQFWRLAEALIDVRLVERPYRERLGLLGAGGIGLWDTIRSGERVGSLDAAISAFEANALVDLAERLPNLRAIAFNGRKASAIGRAELGPDTRFALVDLPSSSPAHTAAFAAKLAAWEALKTYLAAEPEEAAGRSRRLGLL